ncbi:MFS transporter [Microlunatus soli]|uniref:Drug resistance transporter, EmrB/QacA subfamily n=1 Tax=Microlunatus soli TaxID=630515 RepID=A0A1H1Y555_9ACTN|nr:MFS transporter [Microlunatus soli]SDT16544.1 drug resistance transporter, EmrB/QacA subfamily [Microlunatus soli]
MAILLTCCLSLFIVNLDATVVNVALPTIHRELDAPVSGLQWVIDAYTLVLAGLLMLSGSTADRFGRRKVFRIGLVTFGVASTLCALAPSLGWLVGFRMLQAIGGSMLNPVAMSIITNTFTERAERARAIGVWGGVVGISSALGPLLGGALVDSVSWRAIFWINVPIALVAVILTGILVPESRAARPRRFDPVGQLLVILILGSLTFGIIEGAAQGWGRPVIIGCFVLSAASLVVLLWYEPRRDQPLIEVGFFRSLPFSGATLIAISAFAGLSSFLFLNALYLQNLRGMTPFEAGLYTLPMAALTAILAPLSGRLVGHRGPRPSLIIAGIALPSAGVLLCLLNEHTPSWQVIISYVVFGIGFGMVNAPITNTAVSGMPRSQAGVAAATASTSRQVGASLGVAIAGTLVIDTAHGPVPTLPNWILIIAFGLLVLALGLFTTGRTARATAAKIADRLD